MKFTIAHLYYDLMNLYGENANILALKSHLEHHGFKVTITKLSIEDEIDFTKFDLFYIGSGNEESLQLCINHLNQYQKEIKKALENKKYFIITGNALSLFGNYYSHNDNKIKTLQVLDYESQKIDFRIVGEQTLQFTPLKKPIIGFNNRDCILKLVKEKHLFEIIKGTGYVPKSIVEGINKNNFYGTFLLGPILIRNPHFTEYLVKQIMKDRNLKYTYYKDYWEEKAYNEYQKNLLQN